MKKTKNVFLVFLFNKKMTKSEINMYNIFQVPMGVNNTGKNLGCCYFTAFFY